MYKLLFVAVCIVPGERVKKIVCLLQRFNKTAFYKDEIVILIITKVSLFYSYFSIKSKNNKKRVFDKRLIASALFDSLLYSV